MDSNPQTLEVAHEPRLAPSRVGQRLGAYQVVRELGAGGMGSVSLARRVDGAFEQEVAIKIVKGDGDLRRFHAERQILAGLHHPNICGLLDGGTCADGVPFLVMEHIDGEPIDAYCRWHAPPLARRLELFLAVCDAVRYAHRNLVVHCDIKPRNILVTPEGVAKLLDFGIAKLLGGPSRGQTRTGLMTPEYGSPEQVRGQPVTTATDVHALGLLLYELLTGANPFAGAGDHAELLRAIVEVEPPPPSQRAAGRRLRRALRGDLDTIVLRALSKDPARRYAAAGDLAADVERYLRGEPVLARRDSLAYRAGKLVGRHRLAVAAAVALVASLVAGIAATTLQARRAERRFADARRMALALLFDIHDQIKDLAGSTPARKALVEHAVANLDALAADAEGDVSLQRDLAEGYLRLGDVQGRPGQLNLGDAGAARASYDKGLPIVEALRARDPKDLAARRLHVRYLRALARLRWSDGDAAAALAQDGRALAEAETILVARPGDFEARYGLAAVSHDIGEIFLAQRRSVDSLQVSRRALAIFRALLATGTSDPRVARAVPISMVLVGDALLASGDRDGALAMQRDALALREARLAAAPDNGPLLQETSMSRVKVGDVLLDGGDAAGALAQYQRGLELARAALARDPSENKAARNVATFLQKIGRAEIASGARAAAAEHLRESLAMFRDLDARGRTLAIDAEEVARAERDLALALESR